MDFFYDRTIEVFTSILDEAQRDTKNKDKWDVFSVQQIIDESKGAQLELKSSDGDVEERSMKCQQIINNIKESTRDKLNTPYH